MSEDKLAETHVGNPPEPDLEERSRNSRRQFLKGLGTVGAAAIASTPAWGGQSFQDAMGALFQQHYEKMSPEQIKEALARIERNAKRNYGVDIHCDVTPPQEGVVFGYALNISKCKGYRDCVHACVKENNLGRDSQIQYIRVLEMNKGTRNLESSDHYFDPEMVPQEGKYYLPIQCMQCDNPPCVRACPVGATWKEPDGICMAACPYWARHFNWTEPRIPSEEINPDTHYLGNRPRDKGVTEKCHGRGLRVHSNQHRSVRRIGYLGIWSSGVYPAEQARHRN